MRDFRNAYRYRPDVNPVRQKFQGYVNFVFNRDLFGTLYGSPSGGNEFRTTISSLVKTADLPSVTFKTETLNAYNKKRIVNTGVEYQPVNIIVYDTVNNEWLTTIMKYFSYHYMNPRNEQTPGDRDVQPINDNGTLYNRSGSSGNTIAGSRFGFEGSTVFNSNSDGYNTNTTPHFFERIDYVLYHGNKGVQYSLINPVLKEFKPGMIDYADSNAMEFSLSFEYEKFITYNVTNFDLSGEDVDRFENASAFTGPAFIETPEETKPKTLEMNFLGGTPAAEYRRRSAQPTSTGRGTTELTTSATDIDTYSGEFTFSGDSGKRSKEDIFSDTLFDIFDSSITAAINGGSIKDAALQSAIGGIARIADYSNQNRPLPSETATGGVTEETANGNGSN
jgi:hypothetical protein